MICKGNYREEFCNCSMEVLCPTPPPTPESPCKKRVLNRLRQKLHKGTLTELFELIMEEEEEEEEEEDGKTCPTPESPCKKRVLNWLRQKLLNGTLTEIYELIMEEDGKTC